MVWHVLAVFFAHVVVAQFPESPFYVTNGELITFDEGRALCRAVGADLASCASIDECASDASDDDVTGIVNLCEDGGEDNNEYVGCWVGLISYGAEDSTGDTVSSEDPSTWFWVNGDPYNEAIADGDNFNEEDVSVACGVVQPELTGVHDRTCDGITGTFTSIGAICTYVETFHSQTVCDGGSESLSCPSGLLISIGTTFYGRTNDVESCEASSVTDCVAGNLPTEVILTRIRDECGGEEACEVDSALVLNGINFGNLCPDVPKYLHIGYDCGACLESVNLGSSEGLFSNGILFDVVVGSTDIYLQSFSVAFASDSLAGDTVVYVLLTTNGQSYEDATDPADYTLAGALALPVTPLSVYDLGLTLNRMLQAGSRQGVWIHISGGGANGVESLAAAAQEKSDDFITIPVGSSASQQLGALTSGRQFLGKVCYQLADDPPTATPTSVPTATPTNVPTSTPTGVPTRTPTATPTSAPPPAATTSDTPPATTPTTDVDSSTPTSTEDVPVTSNATTRGGNEGTTARNAGIAATGSPNDNASENTPSWLFPVIIVVVLLCCCFLFGVLFCVWRQKKRATTYDRPNPYEESYTDERSAYSRPSDSMDRRASVRLANNHQGGGFSPNTLRFNEQPPLGSTNHLYPAMTAQSAYSNNSLQSGGRNSVTSFHSGGHTEFSVTNTRSVSRSRSPYQTSTGFSSQMAGGGGGGGGAGNGFHQSAYHVSPFAGTRGGHHQPPQPHAHLQQPHHAHTITSVSGMSVMSGTSGGSSGGPLSHHRHAHDRTRPAHTTGAPSPGPPVYSPSHTAGNTLSSKEVAPVRSMDPPYPLDHFGLPEPYDTDSENERSYVANPPVTM